MRARHHNGFTLIEIMVVMVIIAIMTSITVANMPQLAQTADFDEETRRLKLLLEMASDEAVMQGVEFGLKVQDHGYRFYQFDEGAKKWTPLEASPFSPRDMPGTVQLLLDLDGERLTLISKKNKNSKQTTKSSSPDVLILSSGETTPFELTLSQSANLSMTLKTEGYGEFYWVENESR